MKDAESTSKRSLGAKKTLRTALQNWVEVARNVRSRDAKNWRFNSMIFLLLTSATFSPESLAAEDSVQQTKKRYDTTKYLASSGLQDTVPDLVLGCISSDVGRGKCETTRNRSSRSL
jgi:hypothetical protein